MLTLLVGECDPVKTQKYHTFSLEKAYRLFHKKKDISSWESRNESKKMYGGSIKAATIDLIASFSGLPEWADEVVCLRLGLHHQHTWITPHEAELITDISKNDTYRQYCKKYNC